ncbi:MAG: M1 family peptidase, partial [Actinobacteria bacterium]|nr:M1 family peptidase [Actinomycetota bacterium]
MTLDPYRLPLTVLPRHYAVTLEPELDQASFAGTVRIDIEVTEGVERIVLNAIELEVFSVLVDSQPVDFSLDEDTQRLTIAAHLAAGNATIDVAFTGILNDKLRGFYRSTYTDDNGAQQVIACSQMQSTDCRRVFPC